jgi:hypothetical protein
MDLIGQTKQLLQEMNLLDNKQTENMVSEEHKLVIEKQLISDFPDAQEDDIDVLAYNKRKETVISNIKDISKVRYNSASEQKKADEFMDEVMFYLNKDEQNLKKVRATIKEQKEPHLTEEQRKKMSEEQQQDYDYQLFKRSTVVLPKEQE